MNSDDPQDEMMKGEALIRANFGIPVDHLSIEDYSRLLAEALWLESWRLRNKAHVLAHLFGADKKK